MYKTVNLNVNYGLQRFTITTCQYQFVDYNKDTTLIKDGNDKLYAAGEGVCRTLYFPIDFSTHLKLLSKIVY